jgi:malate synthase
VALEVFDELMPQPNQLDKMRADVHVTSADLLTPPEGQVTERGLRQNINVGIRYIESWLGGQGAAAIFNLMEDVATAEISRAQVWQWIHGGATLADGRVITPSLVEGMLAEEMASIKGSMPPERAASRELALAADLFRRVAINDEWVDFLTLVAYQYLP